ncbi:MAG: hypothetical protein R6U40_11340 [Desulfobacterales bacterium]
MESKIFRSVKASHDTTTKLYKFRNTVRPPGYVPYVVDNLWEWKRPKIYPSRRFSVYASPKESSAKKSGPDGGAVYRVEFGGKYKLCQLKDYEDSRHHPNCRDLRKLLFKKLGQDWMDGELKDKEPAGRLWIPCLTKHEMNYLFGSNETLREFREEIYNAITYWNDVVLIGNNMPLADPVGEVFFEAEDGYYLRSI